MWPGLMLDQAYEIKGAVGPIGVIEIDQCHEFIVVKDDVRPVKIAVADPFGQGRGQLEPVQFLIQPWQFRPGGRCVKPFNLFFRQLSAEIRVVVPAMGCVPRAEIVGDLLQFGRLSRAPGPCG